MRTLAGSILVLSLAGCGCGDEGEVTITTSSLPDATVGVEYHTQLEGDGSGDLVWGFASGRIPPGLALSSGGKLDGTPTGAGDFDFTVRVSTTDGAVATKELTLHVDEGDSRITLVTDSLPDGRVGEAYSERLEAEGGLPPYSFGIASGALPPGLSLSAGGLLSGTPEDGIETTLTIRIFDAAGGTGSGRVDLTVIGAIGGPRFETELLGAGRAGEPYGQQLEASGGSPPYTFTNVGRSLPDGLELSEAGLLSGEAEEGGIFELRFEVADQDGDSAERSYYLPITPELLLLTEALPSGVVGEPYDQRLVAEGGAPPLAFSIEQGTLPDGLTLDASGRLHGTPEAGSIGSLRFRVEDAEGFDAARSIPFRVYSFPIVEVLPDVELPSNCDVDEGETFAAEIPVAQAGMVEEIDVGATIRYGNVAYLKVWIESPTGKRVLLYQGEFGVAGDTLDAYWDDEDEPAGDLAALRGEPTQGTWRLVVAVDTDPFGECADGGSIDRVFLAFTTVSSSDDYVRVGGFEGNNQVDHAFARIAGGGQDQHEIDFEVRQWSTGANGIAEGGQGDDEDLGAAVLDWSTDLEGATIDDNGVFEAGEDTGAGTVEGTSGDLSVSLPVAIFPPDWVP